MRRSSRQRIRWHRVGWLLPLALAAGYRAAPVTPIAIDAAREHQVRAYFNPPPLRPPEWREPTPRPIDFDRAMFGGR